MLACVCARVERTEIDSGERVTQMTCFQFIERQSSHHQHLNSNGKGKGGGGGD